MKGFLKAVVVCGGLVFSLQSFGANVEWYYKNFAPIDLAYLKGCGQNTAYEGYISSMTKALKIAPEIDHSRTNEFIRLLLTQVDKEYYMLGFQRYDDYEKSGQPGPNPAASVKEGCEKGVGEALKNRIKINELSIKALSR
ncbi:hypothetical protein [Pseudomonas syringae]|uniref:hypothetical protein n=1 Tax=Pseudomonas syringae TaxID=317 RepID=UPI0012AEDC6A|nr:hypothetical protein [Pseudomonas syringae]